MVFPPLNSVEYPKFNCELDCFPFNAGIILPSAFAVHGSVNETRAICGLELAIEPCTSLSFA
jgi:hypothetical protein